MIWLDQSAASCSVKVSACGSKNSNFISKNNTLENIKLDNCTIEFFRNDKFFLVLQDGTVYIVQLLHDKESPGVKNFTFLYIGCLDVIPSNFICWDPIFEYDNEHEFKKNENDFSSDEKMLFIASRLGDSYLLSCKLNYSLQNIYEKTNKNNKLLNKSSLHEGMVETDTGIADEDSDPEEVMLYSTKKYTDSEYMASSFHQTKRLKFELTKKTAGFRTEIVETAVFEKLNKIVNLGPIVNVELNEHIRILFSNQGKPVDSLRAVMCAGYEKNGAIISVRQFLNPHIVTSIPLKNVTGLWTLFKGENRFKTKGLHDLILVAQQEEYIKDEEKNTSEFTDVSLILETGGKGITEAIHSGFEIDDLTVSSGNISGHFIYQVTRTGKIVILEGTDRITSHNIKKEIIGAASVENYLVIQLVLSGQLYLYKFENKNLIRVTNTLIDEIRNCSCMNFLPETEGFSPMKKVTTKIMEQERKLKNEYREKIYQQFKDSGLSIDDLERGVTNLSDINQIDEEEAWLYGESEAPFLAIKREFRKKLSDIRTNLPISNNINWLFTVTGLRFLHQKFSYKPFLIYEKDLEVYSLEKLTTENGSTNIKVDLCFSMKNVCLGHKLLFDHQVQSLKLNQPKINKDDLSFKLKKSENFSASLEDDDGVANPATPPKDSMSDTSSVVEEGEIPDANNTTLNGTIPAVFNEIDQDRSYRICEINCFINPCQKGKNTLTSPKIFIFLRIRQESDDNKPPLDEIVIYESYDYFTILSLKTDRPTINKSFYRVKVDKQLLLSSEGKTPEIQEMIFNRRKTIFSFDNIDSYSGVIITDTIRPIAVIINEKQEVFLHPITEPDGIMSIAGFNNVNCFYGMVYYTFSGDLRVASLDRDVHKSDAPIEEIIKTMQDGHDWQLDVANMPIKKVILGVTPNFIQYHPEILCYTIVTTTREDVKSLPKINDQTSEIQFELHDRNDKYFTYDKYEKFEAKLYDINFNLLENHSIDQELPIDNFYYVNCLENVALKRKGRGTQAYLAMGTGCAMGEDTKSDGKIVMAEVSEQKKYRIIYNQRQAAGAVTAISSLRGLLIAACGQKMYMFKMSDDDDDQLLSPLAFLDHGMFTTSIHTFKSYALVNDFYKSISLLRYQEIRDLNSLALLGNDRFVDSETYCSNLLVSGNNLGYIKFDSEMNMVIYAYDTFHEQSKDTAGNFTLVRAADTRLLTEVNTTFRIDSKSDKHTEYYHKHCTYYCGQDGSIGLVLPIEETVYRRLSTLQNFLITQVWQPGGLNPKNFKQATTTQQFLINTKSNILDGDLLSSFYNLSVYERRQLTRHMGTSVSQILSDLDRIQKSNLLI